MSKRKSIYFRLNEKQLESDYSNWVLLLYYVKQISKSEYWLLFEFSVNAYSFYSYWKKDESKSSILSEESDYVLFDAQKNSQVEMLNQRVKAINILTTLGLNSKQQSLPSEQGVEFIFENDKQLVLSHNLTENSLSLPCCHI